MRRAFITGIAGQDGAYLARLLLRGGYEVHGGTRAPEAERAGALSALGIADAVRLHRFDLADTEGMARVLQAVEPDEVYNLAGYSSVMGSWRAGVEVAQLNAVAVAAMLAALEGDAARFAQASSADMFGAAHGLCDEETPLRPLSPYGASKAHAHHLVGSARAAGRHACAAIFFNHESPLRGEGFVTRKITLGLARLARGGQEPLELGNLDARRDWGFAGDYVAGMHAMLRHDTPADYVFASGVGTSIQEFVDLAAEALDLALDWEGEGLARKARLRGDGRLAVQVSPRFFRPAEAAALVGDASRARRDLGWAPELGVADLARMMARADYDALG